MSPGPLYITVTTQGEIKLNGYHWAFYAPPNDPRWHNDAPFVVKGVLGETGPISDTGEHGPCDNVAWRVSLACGRDCMVMGIAPAEATAQDVAKNAQAAVDAWKQSHNPQVQA